MYIDSVWVPPQEVRDLRALIAQRKKMVSLSTQARNRLHALLHSRHILPPAGNLFAEQNRGWWRALPLNPVGRVQIENDLDTLEFAHKQIERIEDVLAGLAAGDERTGLLAQLPGFGLLIILAFLGAVQSARLPAFPRPRSWSAMPGWALASMTVA